MLRRGFVCAAALLGAGPGGVAGEDLLDLFTSPAAARALGQHALLAMPEADAATLEGVLERRLAGPGALRSRVAAAAREDFAAGRVTCVDGWLLATVEARLCALVALRSGSGSRAASAPAA